MVNHDYKQDTTYGIHDYKQDTTYGIILRLWLTVANQ